MEILSTAGAAEKLNISAIRVRPLIRVWGLPAKKIAVINAIMESDLKVKIGGHIVNIEAITRIELVRKGDGTEAILFFPGDKHYRISEFDLDDLLKDIGHGEIKEYASVE
jgi:hypothetical protein